MKSRAILIVAGAVTAQAAAETERAAWVAGAEVGSRSPGEFVPQMPAMPGGFRVFARTLSN